MACRVSNARGVLRTIGFTRSHHLRSSYAAVHERCLLKIANLQCGYRAARNLHTSDRAQGVVTTGDGILQSPFGHKEVSDSLSLHDFITNRFDEFGNAVALVDGQSGHQYTYKEVRDTARRLGSALVRLGFKQGDVLCLYTHNLPEYAVVLLAVSGIGGSVSGANPLYTVDELSFQVENTGAKFLVTVPSAAHTVQMVQKRCSHLTELIVIGEHVKGFHSFAELAADDGSLYPDAISINPREDVVAMPYSSGTTGLPKGVMITHFNISANIVQCSYPGGLDGDHGKDAHLAVLPFFHIYGLYMMFVALSRGIKLVTLSKFEPEVFLDCIQQYKVSMLHLVPPIVLLMAKHPMIHNYDLSSVYGVFTAAAPCREELVQEFKQNTGIKYFRQGYGLTEILVAHLASWDTMDVGSVGYPVPNTECKIVDVETRETLGVNQEGELLVRGPQIMKGYLNNEEATKQTIDEDGWFHTGDVFRYNEDGLFYITDRIKELIKYKSFQVAPAELENLLLTHPCVKDCAVIGIPDEEAGELPRAYVVLKPDSKSSETDILEFANVKVAPSKKLRGGVKFIDAIPKTASGKILRRVLKDVAIADKS